MSDARPTESSGEEKGEQAEDKSPDVSKLSPEEQMALYEKDLKENDWGHQPC